MAVFLYVCFVLLPEWLTNSVYHPAFMHGCLGSHLEQAWVDACNGLWRRYQELQARGWQ